MASLNNLTDDELRKKLKEYGILSPITPSTRTILLKKLNHVISSEKNKDNSKSSANVTPDRQNKRKSLGNSSPVRVSPRSRFSFNSKSRPTESAKTNIIGARPNLSSLSSDEDDDDQTEETQPRRSLRINNHEDSLDSPSTSVKILNLSDSASYGKKLPVVKKRAGYSPISYTNIKPPSRSDNYDEYYDSESDSDMYIENDSRKMQNTNSSKIFGSIRSNIFGNDISKRKYNDNYNYSPHSKLVLNSKLKNDHNVLDLQNNYGTAYRGRDSPYDGGDTEEITSPDDIVFQEPINTNGQNCVERVKKLLSEHFTIDKEFWLPSVPLFLVILVILFFCFLGLCYISIHTSLGPSKVFSFLNVFHRTNDINQIEDSAAGLDLYETSERGKQKFPVCEHETRMDCLSKLEMENVSEILGLLASIIVPALSHQSSQYQCGKVSLQYITTKEMTELIRNELSDKSEPNIILGLEGLGKLVRLNSHWGIQSFRKESEETPSELLGFGLISNPLEIVCLIKSALHNLLYCVVALLFGLFGVWIAYKIYMYFTRQAEEVEQKSYELVEQILEVLENSCGTCGKDFIAVNHVRDCLIPPRERIAKSKIWDKAVRFIDDHDSRVYREIRSVGGEDCEVWRWVSGAPRSPVSCSKNPMEPDTNQLPEKIWQGQAFESLETTQNLPHVSPTSCLKIRNMFDSEMEFGEHWPSRIQDSLLEKCEGIDITHVAVDRVSKEGCVYVKCASAAEAGKAYRALHGWWFDGKLVTVKYLREERYFERFPTARISSTPLTPSNNKRLSLQLYPSLAPFMNSSNSSPSSSQPSASKGTEMKRRSHTRSQFAVS